MTVPFVAPVWLLIRSNPGFDWSFSPGSGLITPSPKGGTLPMSGPVAEQLLTAQEYLQLPDRGIPTELVRGRVVERNVPAPRHGEICVNVIALLNPHLRA